MLPLSVSTAKFHYLRRRLVHLHLQAEHRFDGRHGRGLPRMWEGCSCVLRSCLKQQLEQFSTQRKPMGSPLEALWPFMSACDILQMRVTSKEATDTQKYGPCGELFFFLMRQETFPMEAVWPRHVSTERPFFLRPSGRLASFRQQGPSEPGSARMALLASTERPDGPEAGPASFARAGRAHTGTPFFLPSDASAEATHRVF